MAETGSQDGRPAGTDWKSVVLWRKAARQRLIDERMAIRGEERARCNNAITGELARLLPGAKTIGFYWPFRGEVDLRDFVASLIERGARPALPVVVQKGAPLIFREWRPDALMTSGVWNIPVPADGETLVPEVLLVPLVGFDPRLYRLGYGGGFYDRTLAAMPRVTRAIGVGYERAYLETIYPQAHDIPMSVIVTDRRVLGSASSRA